MSGQLSEAEEKLQQLDSNQRSLSSHWLTEREDLKTSVERLKTRAAELEKTNAEKQRRLKELVGAGPAAGGGQLAPGNWHW